MCGMGFAVPWGFDIGLTLVSLATVVVFGTSAITLALMLRQQLQPLIQKQFGQQVDSPGPLFYLKLLQFILSHVPFFKLLLAVLLLVIGAAGCHHLGMWSIHGINGKQLACGLNFWSFLTTVGLGGIVCVVAIVAFLLVPEGVHSMTTAIALTAGIAAFHYSSAIWGLQYMEGSEGVTTNIVIGQEAIITFVVAQGAINQLITAVFSRMAVQNHSMMMKQLQVAQMLGKHIADMDLEPAKAMQLEAANPSVLEQTLFHIVNNLLLYRPYLPDTLFTGAPDELNPSDGKEAEEREENEDGASDNSKRTRSGSHRSSSLISSANSVHQRVSNTLLETKADAFPYAGRHASHLSVDESSDHSRCRRKSRKLSRISTGRPSVVKEKTPDAKNSAQKLTVGLKASHLTILRIRLQGLEFGGSKSLNAAKVEERLMLFSVIATAQIKVHGGTIVTCASGMVLAFWPSIRPDRAIETAINIQQQCNLDLIQVVQSAPFLSGNLATEQLRSFNVVGPLDWAGQQLLRAGRGERHIFVTSYEWERVHFKYTCLPYEQVLMDGKPSTLYTVLDTATNGEDREWMYEVGNNLQATPFEEVEKCWQAYARGDYQTAISLAESLNGVPSWYSTHLQAIAFHAAASSVKLPTKCLESLGWPNSMTHQGAILLRDL
eukprot:GGOE01010684.1.p1 GENE.GGOE01010684.1~~GGOE01010684.1.p1  ORF type:complete len:661 (-),score=172.29 GGOE01010684.1:1055-3037(-)